MPARGFAPVAPHPWDSGRQYCLDFEIYELAEALEFSAFRIFRLCRFLSFLTINAEFGRGTNFQSFRADLSATVHTQPIGAVLNSQKGFFDFFEI